MLNSRAQCPPASPQSPPRGYSRAVSWYGRPNHQAEPHAPGVPLSGRCAAGSPCAAPPTMGLSAQQPYRMAAAAHGLAMVRHHLAAVRDGCMLLQVVHRGRNRPVQLVAVWPSECLRGHRKGHLAVRIRRRFGLLQGRRLHWRRYGMCTCYGCSGGGVAGRAAFRPSMPSGLLVLGMRTGCT